jgi:hypothetical protein
MIAVALMGVSSQVVRWHVKRSRAYLGLAERRAARKSVRTVVVPGKGSMGINRFGELLTPEREHWYAATSDKYYRAAFVPWLPVEPDPPWPK